MCVISRRQSPPNQFWNSSKDFEPTWWWPHWPPDRRGVHARVQLLECSGNSVSGDQIHKGAPPSRKRKLSRKSFTFSPLAFLWVAFSGLGPVWVIINLGKSFTSSREMGAYFCLSVFYKNIAYFVAQQTLRCGNYCLFASSGNK